MADRPKPVECFIEARRGELDLECGRVHLVGAGGDRAVGDVAADVRGELAHRANAAVERVDLDARLAGADDIEATTESLVVWEDGSCPEASEAAGAAAAFINPDALPNPSFSWRADASVRTACTDSSFVRAALPRE